MIHAVLCYRIMKVVLGWESRPIKILLLTEVLFTFVEFLLKINLCFMSH